MAAKPPERTPPLFKNRENVSDLRCDLDVIARNVWVPTLRCNIDYLVLIDGVIHQTTVAVIILLREVS